MARLKALEDERRRREEEAARLDQERILKMQRDKELIMWQMREVEEIERRRKEEEQRRAMAVILMNQSHQKDCCHCVEPKHDTNVIVNWKKRKTSCLGAPKNSIPKITVKIETPPMTEPVKV